jgi:hypothetical protein
MKTILICGNGLSLHKTLKDKNLDSFDYVLRMNNWKSIDNADNRCDIWCTTFWYDISDQTIISNKNKIVWDIFLNGGCFPFTTERINKVKQLLNKYPEFVLLKKELNYFKKNIIQINSPSCGMYAIYAAKLHNFNISICGFDHTVKRPHKPKLELLFVQKLLMNKEIQLFT